MDFTKIPSNLKQREENIKDDIKVIITRKENLIELLLFLRDNSEFEFNILTDITACDYPEREMRFEVIYNLLSIKYNKRIIIKTFLAENDWVDSITEIYSSSLWYEREVWDMYGIVFRNNPDLRRILTDYGFTGHPLRKDFPLTGYVQVKYDLERKKVIYEPVKLTQEFRSFDFLSPWEGPDYILPGDEKAVKG